MGNSEDNASKSIYRFQHNPATNMLDDYQQALSLLFSDAQTELQREHDEARKCGKEGKMIPEPEMSVPVTAQNRTVKRIDFELRRTIT